MGRPPIYPSTYARLVANTEEDADGCWIWTGSVNRGYPTFSMRIQGLPHPRSLYAHRVMLEEVHGFYFPFDHAGHWRCYKPLCIRPDCLRVETVAENLSDRRGYAPTKGRWLPVLFPTEKKQLEDRIDTFLDAYFAGLTGERFEPHTACPF